MLNADEVAVLVIDFQEALLAKIPSAPAIVPRAARFLEFARVLELPLFWTEQYRKGLGPTVPEIARHLEGLSPVEKLSFGCFGEEAFLDAVEAQPRQWLLLGVEAHVCVLQTALGALERGAEVFVARDAVASRDAADCECAFDRLRDAGAHLATTEMAMFEILRRAGTPQFRRVLPLIKQ